VKSAEKDWRVAGHLFDKKDYAYALFFGHLTLEKTLKGLLAAKADEQPPLTHRLLFLAEH
jgi:HEPN domain-containing protein